MSVSRRRTRQPGWPQSAQFRAIGRAAIAAWNARRPELPKCGARAKSTGEPCQQLALENGRCAWHGGKTGRKDQWHVPQWPSKSSPKASEKLNSKLRDRERQARKRAKRVAAMTPEERQRYEEWKRTHKPGPAGLRASERARRAQSRNARERFATMEEPFPQSAEAQALLDEIEHFKHMLGELNRLPKPAPETDELGVFG